MIPFEQKKNILLFIFVLSLVSFSSLVNAGASSEDISELSQEIDLSAPVKGQEKGLSEGASYHLEEADLDQLISEMEKAKKERKMEISLKEKVEPKAIKLPETTQRDKKSLELNKVTYNDSFEKIGNLKEMPNKKTPALKVQMDDGDRKVKKVHFVEDEIIELNPSY